MGADRKLDHIKLAFQSQMNGIAADNRFFYEPMLSGHPAGEPEEIPFAGKKLKAPVWVSSMTGGTRLANTINHNLARACGEFGLGMGLGSCRKLLDGDTYFPDFDVRADIGEQQPLYTNLGIAQVEVLLDKGQTDKIERLIDRLRADGLIVHINPMQEWLQPEGNFIQHPPIETVERLLEEVNFPVIVKEVGQGFGPESLLRLLKLPLAAVDFGAFGGTNFARIELERNSELNKELYGPFVWVGMSAEQMLDVVNQMVDGGEEIKCRQLIISGGIQNFLDGYYLTGKSKLPAIYAQASAFLKYSQGEYEVLRNYVEAQLKGLRIAKAFLRINENYSE
ncbi:type 2 isopentenyl-diphosphate Delta-isomerase [Prolixibacter sp. SD074]|jgi:isopentenyl-diphosphate delta-isomerase|uniref:type 2 isopentenyl-diphosphate Delta-isomerase n=1 Tax=Prolixibacter sp. SD074 TaxID=2652391 RepID=UPI0012840837|nr:type 2 isopentenyl-diphosphate Delta-isomerase [Prolixibacter sp. SD074]GET29096.1 isopentenyl-diphosphate delta-isomerase [Prolixibacter sp. SD074]